MYAGPIFVIKKNHTIKFCGKGIATGNRVSEMLWLSAIIEIRELEGKFYFFKVLLSCTKFINGWSHGISESFF
jgi:hypothetical protein